MNRTFNILWFEDELGWFNMEQRRIISILEEHFLTPCITRKNGDDFNITEVCDNCHDLILIDYNLIGITGEKIIAAIRGNDILTDTLFYSSEEDKMLTAIYQLSPPIDGIYYTKRDYQIFTEKVRGIINKIVKRSEDLINLRGFVLDDSCDFEVRVREILNIAWQKFSDSEKVVLEKAVCKDLDRISQWQAEGKNKITNETPCFSKAINSKSFFAHSNRLYILTKVIKILQDNHGFQPQEQHKNFKANYENALSQYRNALGHRKSGEDSIEISGKFIPIDRSLHQQMRQSLSLYDSLINDIEIFITEQL